MKILMITACLANLLNGILALKEGEIGYGLGLVAGAGAFLILAFDSPES